MENELIENDLVRMLAKASAQIMRETGDPFEVALPKAKQGLKEYIKLRVETTRDLVSQGYSKEHAFKRARELVDLASLMRLSK